MNEALPSINKAQECFLAPSAMQGRPKCAVQKRGLAQPRGHPDLNLQPPKLCERTFRGLWGTQ